MKKQKTLALTQNMLRIFKEQHLPIASAGFSYFMMLSLFPMMICLYTILGSMFPARAEIQEVLSPLLPEETVDVVISFLRYVSGNLSTTMSVVAAIVMLTSASALFRLISSIMSDMRGQSRFSSLFGLMFSFVFAVVFLLAMIVGVLLIGSGQWLLDFIAQNIPFIHVFASWRWWRFVLLFLLLYAVISALYRFTAPKAEHVRVIPGAVAASLALVAVSLLFSYFIGLSIKYPLVYGSMGSIIILMFWFYICGFVLFLGNALNVSLELVNE